LISASSIAIANRIGVVAVMGLLLSCGGCAAAFYYDGSSASVGTHSDGALRQPARLPMDGDGYTVPTPWRVRNSNFGTDELVGLVVRSARAVDQRLPGGVAAIGDLSHRGGGASVEHKSHQSGRDVDVFYYALDRSGRPVAPGDAMLRFDVEGRAVRWSPPRGVRPPPRPVPPYRFDVRRNWAMVRALITDPGAEVQWIFIQRGLAAMLIREAAAAGEDPAVLTRAAFILHEPTDSEPHDDHMHVRLYCDSSDRGAGCVDRGPIRWWKKLWKYMAPPFARPSDRAADVGEAVLRAMRDELPPIFVGGALTS
jgi:penicillin-insensitive murein endopeptidase